MQPGVPTTEHRKLALSGLEQQGVRSKMQNERCRKGLQSRIALDLALLEVVAPPKQV